MAGGRACRGGASRHRSCYSAPPCHVAAKRSSCATQGTKADSGLNLALGIAPLLGCRFEPRALGAMIQKTRRDGSLDGKGVVMQRCGSATSRTPSAASKLGLVTQWLTRMPLSRARRSKQKSEAGVVYPANRTGPCFHRRSRSSKNRLVMSPRIAAVGIRRSAAPAANAHGPSNRSSKTAL
jgi:hypothetical protein